MKKLLIVESPAKQKTIEKILGPNFIVRASYGHIRDFTPVGLGIDEKTFVPSYAVLDKAVGNLQELVTQFRSCDTVYLATDPDREGEAISWHLLQVLDTTNKQVYRVTFNEITPTAVLNAIKNPRQIDLNLVSSQQTRRILDRLIGYKISPLLWFKIKIKSLSAGRVQSIALRLITERQLEIGKFNKETYYTINASAMTSNNTSIETKLHKIQKTLVDKTIDVDLFADTYTSKTSTIKTEEEAKKLVNIIKQEGQLVVTSIEAKETSQKPYPPFTTSTLQQAAFGSLGWDPNRTMRVAQTLYEGIDLPSGHVGLITYMRTDSVAVSKDAYTEAQQFLNANFSKEYVPNTQNVYHNKSKNAQEAHESIHPTSSFRIPSSLKSNLTKDQLDLYDLIWRRFMASQMTPARYKSTTVELSCTSKLQFKTTGRVLLFDGYLCVYNASASDDQVLPTLKEGDILKITGGSATAHETTPPPYYNEASLVKILEKNGIGRPSTYASIIKTILERDYVKKTAKRLEPTEIGISVVNYLVKHFPNLMSLEYTNAVEQTLDEIAEGKVKEFDALSQLYNPLKVIIKQEAATSEDLSIQGPACPKCGAPTKLRQGRFGPFYSCSKYPDCKGIVSTKAPSQILQTKCPDCGKSLVVRSSKRGKFIGCTGYPNCKHIEAYNESIK